MAIAVAIRHPKLIGRLAVNGSNYGKIDDAYEPEAAKQFRSMPANFAPPILKDHYDKVAPDPKRWPALVAKIKNMGLEFKGLADDVKSIKAPVLITLGDRDAVRPEHAVELFDFIPKAQLAIFPAATTTSCYSRSREAPLGRCGLSRRAHTRGPLMAIIWRSAFLSGLKL